MKNLVIAECFCPAVALKKKARPGGACRAQLSSRRGIRGGGPHAQSILDSDEAQDCQAVSDVRARSIGATQTERAQKVHGPIEVRAHDVGTAHLPSCNQFSRPKKMPGRRDVFRANKGISRELPAPSGVCRQSRVCRYRNADTVRECPPSHRHARNPRVRERWCQLHAR